jgi:hypothetical protein
MQCLEDSQGRLHKDKYSTISVKLQRKIIYIKNQQLMILKRIGIWNNLISLIYKEILKRFLIIMDHLMIKLRRLFNKFKEKQWNKFKV